MRGTCGADQRRVTPSEPAMAVSNGGRPKSGGRRDGQLRAISNTTCGTMASTAAPVYGGGGRWASAPVSAGRESELVDSEGWDETDESEDEAMGWGSYLVGGLCGPANPEAARTGSHHTAVPPSSLAKPVHRTRRPSALSFGAAVMVARRARKAARRQHQHQHQHQPHASSPEQEARWHTAELTATRATTEINGFQPVGESRRRSVVSACDNSEAPHLAGAIDADEPHTCPTPAASEPHHADEDRRQVTASATSLGARPAKTRWYIEQYAKQLAPFGWAIHAATLGAAQQSSVRIGVASAAELAGPHAAQDYAKPTSVSGESGRASTSAAAAPWL
jgi:hypothetical protein